MSEVKVKDPAAFVKAFLERYLGNGFGTMQKREIDVLVFHLISDISQIKGQSNYEIANFLKVSESRVKSLRLDAGLRYRPASHKAVLGKVVMNIVDRMKKPDFEGGYLSMTLEDPVEKRELEHAVKQSGQQVEIAVAHPRSGGVALVPGNSELNTATAFRIFCYQRMFTSCRG